MATKSPLCEKTVFAGPVGIAPGSKNGAPIVLVFQDGCLTSRSRSIEIAEHRPNIDATLLELLQGPAPGEVVE